MIQRNNVMVPFKFLVTDSFWLKPNCGDEDAVRSRRIFKKEFSKFICYRNLAARVNDHSRTFNRNIGSKTYYNPSFIHRQPLLAE